MMIHFINPFVMPVTLVRESRNRKRYAGILRRKKQ